MSTWECMHCGGHIARTLIDWQPAWRHLFGDVECETGGTVAEHATRQPRPLDAWEAGHMRADLVRTRRALQHCWEGHRRRSDSERDGAILDRTFKRQYETAKRQAALNLDRALRAERLAATMAQRALAAELELDRIKRGEQRADG